MVVFDRPIGAPADVKELEYVSALHQTARTARLDGSITAQDIKLFLRSRFGIEISVEEVRNTILQGMGGGSDQDGEVIDLMELVAILLIPYLCKAAAVQRGERLPEGVQAPSHFVLKNVTRMMLHDVGIEDDYNNDNPYRDDDNHGGSGADEENGISKNNKRPGLRRPGLRFSSMNASNLDLASTGDAKPPPALTPDLIRSILRAYGEDGFAANDELIRAMFQACQGHKHLTPQALAQALTQDVQLYDLANEVRYTNSYQDVFEQHDDENDDAQHKKKLARTIKDKSLVTETETKDSNDTDKEVPTTNEDTSVRPTNCISTENPTNTDAPVEVSMNFATNKDSTPNDDSTGSSKTANNVADEEDSTPQKAEELATVLCETREDSKPLFIKKYTAPAIDSTAGTYRSKALLVILWAGVLFGYFSTSRREKTAEGVDCGVYIIGGSWADNLGPLLCQSISSIVIWLAHFFGLLVFGVVYMGLGSLGNADGNKSPLKPIIAIVFHAIGGVISFEREGTSDLKFVGAVSLICSILAIVYHSMHAIYLLSSKDSDLRKRLGNHAMQDEVDHKTATFFKVNRLVDNAIDIHHSDDSQRIVKTCFGHGLHVFSKHKKTERIGGLVWSWKQIWTGTLFKREGVWYSARLMAASAAQYIVVVYMVLAGLRLIREAEESFDEEHTRQTMHKYVNYLISNQVDQEEVLEFSSEISGMMGSLLGTLNKTGVVDYDCSGVLLRGSEVFTQTCPEFLQCEVNQSAVTLCALLEDPTLDNYTQMTLLGGTGLNTTLLMTVVTEIIQNSLDESINSMYPKDSYMITLPLIVATIMALIVSTLLAVSYLPSITSTTLQLRSGVIPSLTDKELNKYRVAPDTVTMLTGSLFWGCLFAGVLVGALFGLLTFLFVWQGSIYFVQRFVAVAIGIGVAVIFRIIFMLFWRAKLFQGFYRKRPAAANIYFLAMEWANFALTAGFVFVRMVKLILVTGFSVGRIDTPFLAKGVGLLGPLELDPFPTIHMRDIMSHEAHRHPYIDALGTIYLMKLRHGSSFVTNAGSCWRLIFVYALMPWMSKYRIFNIEDRSQAILEEDDDDEKETEELELAKSLRAAKLHDGLSESFAVRPCILTRETMKHRRNLLSNSSARMLSLERENLALRERVAALEEASAELKASRT